MGVPSCSWPFGAGLPGLRNCSFLARVLGVTELRVLLEHVVFGQLLGQLFESCLDSCLDHVMVLFRKVLVTRLLLDTWCRLLLDTGCVVVDLLHCRGVLGVGGVVVGLHRSWGEKSFSVLVATQACSSTNNF